MCRAPFQPSLGWGALQCDTHSVTRPWLWAGWAGASTASQTHPSSVTEGTPGDLGSITPPDGLSGLLQPRDLQLLSEQLCSARAYACSMSHQSWVPARVFCEMLYWMIYKLNKLVFLGKVSIAFIVNLILLVFLEDLIGTVHCVGPLLRDGLQDGFSTALKSPLLRTWLFYSNVKLVKWSTKLKLLCLRMKLSINI